MSDYSTERKRQWRVIIKNRIVESLGGCCANCKIKFNKSSMYDIHHINPNEKDFTISNIQTNGAKAWLKIRDELRKCCILCPNCHRGYHQGEIDIDFKDTYFNDSFYEWDVTREKLIKISDNKLIPIKRNIQDTLICPVCGGSKSYGGEICRKCLSKKQWRCEHPSKEEMMELIKNYSILEISKMYKVSDNTIRNWLSNYNLPTSLKEIKKFNAGL